MPGQDLLLCSGHRFLSGIYALRVFFGTSHRLFSNAVLGSNALTGSGFCENVVILTTFSYSMFAAERCARRQLGRFVLFAQKKLLSFRAEISAAKLIFADPCKRFVLVRKLDFFHFKLDKAVLFQDAVAEFPIVKDTTPNMMNPRLYTTSYNKPQGQQFDDTAVLSFIKLQYT